MEVNFYDEEVLKIKKQNELLKNFIINHIELIQKELDKDGWCTLSCDYETLESFKKVLEQEV